MSRLAQYNTARLAGGGAHVHVGNRATFSGNTTTYTDPIKQQDITANDLHHIILSVGKVAPLGHAPSLGRRRIFHFPASAGNEPMSLTTKKMREINCVKKHSSNRRLVRYFCRVAETDCYLIRYSNWTTVRPFLRCSKGFGSFQVAH